MNKLKRLVALMLITVMVFAITPTTLFPWMNILT